jgi:hypothetical protein
MQMLSNNGKINHSKSQLRYLALRGCFIAHGLRGLHGFQHDVGRDFDSHRDQKLEKFG